MAIFEPLPSAPLFVIDDAILAAIVSGVAGELTGRGLKLLQGNPEKRAFKEALREATRAFGRDYPDWTGTLFSNEFLRGPATPILAGALMRDTSAMAEALAEAYADYFPRDGVDRSRSVSQVTPLAADFLLRFDIALRRQSALREHFDSRALDASAYYLYDLVRLAGEGWAREREFRVTEALEFFAGAATRYGEAGRARRAGEAVDNENLTKAREAMTKGYLRLTRMRYTDIARLRDAVDRLVVDRYDIVSSAVSADVDQAIQSLMEGVDEFVAYLAVAAPV